MGKNKEEVASLIDEANVFDDFHFGKEGHYWKSLVCINASTLLQPRCITLSVTIDEGHEVLLPTGYHGCIQQDIDKIVRGLFGLGCHHQKRGLVCKDHIIGGGNSIASSREKDKT